MAARPFSPRSSEDFCWSSAPERDRVPCGGTCRKPERSVCSAFRVVMVVYIGPTVRSSEPRARNPRCSTTSRFEAIRREPPAPREHEGPPHIQLSAEERHRDRETQSARRRRRRSRSHRVARPQPVERLVGRGHGPPPHHPPANPDLRPDPQLIRPGATLADGCAGQRGCWACPSPSSATLKTNTAVPVG